ncbi:DUF4097 family beta strand repeat-containing protein [Acidipila sp. EB88]|uniref:DUF4097 family beta strand repeat-containing protein n=1 Tax=Acidipila sp. EB88 TaxID=2305226 RepID=UPI000F5EBC65|nr:DUF4097 family beta strand repeat-containing protein [Acidipila sp. EB88]RRA48688.1 hypothetical protein D1Y84_10750 [Acidipila sp. EB88]
MNPFLFRRIRGPVFLLCFAVTAILAQWGILNFAQSWPLYLIVAGLLRFCEAVFGSVLLQGYNAVPGAPLVRRPSITLAVSEILIGILLLLIMANSLPFATFWQAYARWWPLLLIVIGVLLLLERTLDTSLNRRAAERFGPGGFYIPRRRRSGGLVILVLILIATGALGRWASFVPSNDFHWDPDWNWNWSLTGETHENDVALEEPFVANGTITIDNGRGDVEISPSTDDRIHVTAHQLAHVADRDKDKAFQNTRPVLAVHGSSATVTVPERSGVEVKLVVLVPDSAACTVSTHHGDLSVSGLRKALTVNQDHGSVALDSLGGPVRLKMDHGDVHARALTSDLAIEGWADDVTASDIGGRVTLNGDFMGDTELDTVKGSVGFHSHRTDLDLAHMDGHFSLDSDNLKIDGASGGVKLKTRSKDVEVTGLSGDATIVDSNSDVSVTGRKPLGTVTIENNTGDVTLAVPAAVGFSIHGQTGQDDELSSEFPLTQSVEGGRKQIAGQVGAGGPHIELSTLHGDLRIQRSSGEGIAVPTPPTPPTPPDTGNLPGTEKRSGHIRHLETKGEPPVPVAQ